MNRAIITGLLVVVTCFVLFADTARAAVEWSELDWNIRGEETTTEVQSDGSLKITTIGGSSNDPGVDNWALYANLPQQGGQNPMWMEFSFLDETAADISYGPRAYASASHDGGETLIQGGVYTGYPIYIENYHRWDGGWVGGNWYYDSTRTNGEHSFKVGLFGDGSVGMWFDGVLVDHIYEDEDSFPELPENGFTKAYLGMTGTVGDDFSVTYTDFQYGYSTVPEPTSMAIWGLLGAGCAGAAMRRRRKQNAPSTGWSNETRQAIHQIIESGRVND